jgi:FkbM family methyltransferase
MSKTDARGRFDLDPATTMPLGKTHVRAGHDDVRDRLGPAISDGPGPTLSKTRTEIPPSSQGVMNNVRRLVDRSPARRVLLHPSVRRVGARAMMMRFVPAAWQLRRPVRFLLAEAVGGGGVGCYALRGRDASLFIKHGAGGLELVAEIFRDGCYEPPGGLSRVLPPNPVILDVGGNVGAFATFAATRWAGSRIVSIEPDQENLRLLRATQAFNGFDMEIIEACASVSDEPVHFRSGLGTGSLLASDGDEFPALDVLPLLEMADLAKIDIEGGEWSILSDPRLGAVDNLLLVMEYHNAGCPALPALSEARRLLENAGFTVGHVRSNYWGHGILWAWKHPDSKA